MKENIDLIAIEKKLWGVINVLRDELPPEDLIIILFLLVLKKEGILKHACTDDTAFSKLDLHLTIDEYVKQNTQYEAIEEVFADVEDTIEKLNQITLQEVLKQLNSIDDEALASNYILVFDNLIIQLTNLYGKSYQFFQPFELTELISDLANISSGQVIYNPFAGIATLATFIPDDTLYVGDELNKKILAVGKLRCFVHKKETVYIFNNDSVKNWNPKEILFDLIYANPPFNLKINSQIDGAFGPIKTAEHFFIEKGLGSLKDNGKLIAVVPNSTLFKEGPEHDLRNHIVDNDLLEMVISFPTGLLGHTALPFSLIVINKGKIRKWVVKFINASSFVYFDANRHKKIDNKALFKEIKSFTNSANITEVAIERIKTLDYNLSVPIYFNKPANGTPVGNLVTIARGYKPIGGETGKFIRIRDLADDINSFYLDISKIETTEIPKQAVKITESVLLIAGRWSRLKPTYFKYNGEPIFISQDIFSVVVNESKVNPEYLAYELSTDMVSEQVNALRIGTIIPSLRKQDFLRVEINLPKLEEQSFVITGLKEALIREKQKEIDYLKDIHGLKTELYEQNAYLRHSLAGPTSNLKGSFLNIKSILEEKVKPQLDNIMDLKVSPSHNLSFGGYLNILEREINKISDTISKSTQVQDIMAGKRLEPLDIISFLKDYSSELKEAKRNDYSVVLNIDSEMFLDENGNELKAYMLANRGLLRDLFDNLIENAEKHAFASTKNNRIEFVVTASAVETINNAAIVIFISNTGKGFEKEFTLEDFCRKNGMAGDTAGEGFGGYYICEIIKYMNGKIEIVNERDPKGIQEVDLATTFDISFPLIQTEINENV